MKESPQTFAALVWGECSPASHFVFHPYVTRESAWPALSECPLGHPRQPSRTNWVPLSRNLDCYAAFAGKKKQLLLHIPWCTDWCWSLVSYSMWLIILCGIAAGEICPTVYVQLKAWGKRSEGWEAGKCQQERDVWGVEPMEVQKEMGSHGSVAGGVRATVV